MNPTSSSSTNGRCGMCGSCGTMPPWAPEMLKTASPEARLALERRMRELQRRFIEERDAKRKPQQVELSHQNILRGAEDPDQESEEESTQQTEAENNNSPAISLGISEKVTNHQDKLSDERNGAGYLSLDTQTEESIETHLASAESLTPLESGAFVEDDADIEIPLDQEGLPPRILQDNQSDDKTITSFLSDDKNALQRPRRNSLAHTSPALQESPAPPENPELQTFPHISLEPNQLSEPLRTISLRDADSDADSFHTANEDEILRRSSDRIMLQGNDEEEDNVAPIVSQTEWQAFQDEHDFTTKIPVTNQDASLEGHASEVSHSERSLQSASSNSSQPNEILEDSITTAHQNSGEAPSAQARQDVLPEDYAIERNFVLPKETTAVPQACQDCERWRERVQELELKVEALTSALDARERETASMRARSVDRHYHGKNEAQLIQECESLRMTTEYLVSFLGFSRPSKVLTRRFFFFIFLKSITSWSDTRESSMVATPMYIKGNFGMPTWPASYLLSHD